MSRVAGVNIPDNKRVVISLTYVCGIGSTIAQKICSDLKIDDSKRVKDLSEKELADIRSLITKNYEVEGDLRRRVSQNIKTKKNIKCYQGLRHIKRLPVRGQNTNNNARTRKGGKSVAIAGKKKAV